MARLRVLAIDDSALARKVVKDSLAGLDDIELVAAVGSCSLAVARCATELLDAIVLDLFLLDEPWPTALARLRQAAPKARVLALAPASSDGRAALAQALAQGASEQIARPVADADFSMGARAFGEQLVAKLRGMCGAPAGRTTPAAASATPAPLPARAATMFQPRPALPPRRSSPPRSRIDIVAIGVSTGGPNALTEFLPGIPEDFPVPIVLVQHMPPGFTLNLAQNLDSKCRIDVREGVEGDVLRPGLALIAPGDFHMVLQRKGPSVSVSMHQGPPENFCRPAVDVLFRSVAEVYGGNVLCAVLTGMGQDGMLGAEVISGAGGLVIAQDEATSVVWGMPGAVARAGLADQILPLGRIAGEIDRRVRESRGEYARGA